MNSLTLIYFVRHGHVHNPLDVYYGRLPGFGLSEIGVQQARDLSRLMKNKRLVAIFSSPLVRARETALIIHSAHGSVPLYFSKLLNEVHTPFDGHPISEIVARDWDVYTGVSPEYEQPSDVLRRALKFISRVRRKYSSQQVIAVTHGDLIASSILWAKAVTPSSNRKQDFRLLELSDEYPAPGSISTFIFRTNAEGELPSVEYINPSH